MDVSSRYEGKIVYNNMNGSLDVDEVPHGYKKETLPAWVKLESGVEVLLLE